MVCASSTVIRTRPRPPASTPAPGAQNAPLSNITGNHPPGQMPRPTRPHQGEFMERTGETGSFVVTSYRSTRGNVFLSAAKDDFPTPDFTVYRCPDEPWTPIFADDVLIVGEVLPPSHHIRQMLAKRARYAEAGISEYREVIPGREGRRIDTVLTYALSTPGELPPRRDSTATSAIRPSRRMIAQGTAGHQPHLPVSHHAELG